jgi:hypothetical protein
MSARRARSLARPCPPKPRRMAPVPSHTNRPFALSSPGPTYPPRRCAHFQGSDGKWNKFGGRLAWDAGAICNNNPGEGGDAVGAGPGARRGGEAAAQRAQGWAAQPPAAAADQPARRFAFLTPAPCGTPIHPFPRSVGRPWRPQDRGRLPGSAQHRPHAGGRSGQQGRPLRASQLPAWALARQTLSAS